MDPAQDEIVAQRFARDLRQLHQMAGRPSYSDLGKASNHELKRATVSDILNGKRVNLPDWRFVSAFVAVCRAAAQESGLDPQELGTVADWKRHWDAATSGSIDAQFPGHSRQPTSSPKQAEAEQVAREPSVQAVPAPAVRRGERIWGPVPPPLNYFVGRESLLEDLHSDLSRNDRTSALVIQGIGGIGKTQLAIQYAHRYRSEYDLVWWISCDTQELARSGMAELASKFEHIERTRAPGESEFAVVFDMLRSSQAYARWLLIFDNANEPDEIRDLIPSERGHVLITSRNYEWNASDTLRELDVFKRSESVEFLRHRKRELSEAEAQQLADGVGDHPLALEHAAESEFQIEEYLSRLEDDPLSLLSRNPPSAYTVTVADTWLTVLDQLRTGAPDAMDLLGCLAFFGNAPIPRESLERGGFLQEISLHPILRDPIRLGRAVGALRRAGLLDVRPATRTLHVHRLTQRLVRGALSAAEAGAAEQRRRHDVHLLLAAADPANPGDFDYWPRYPELRGHMDSSDVAGCPGVAVRHLVVNVVRYLAAAGDPKTALSVAEAALGRWSAEAGTEGLDPLALDPRAVDLAMHRSRAEILCALGRYRDAFEVAQKTLEKMRSVPDSWPGDIPVLSSMRGTRFRQEGEFALALAADLDSRDEHIEVFGPDHPQTFTLMDNLTIDYALNEDYGAASEAADEVYRACRTFYGRPDHPSVLFQQNLLARCRRLAGQYEVALEIANEVQARYRSIIERNAFDKDHPSLLVHEIDLVAARRDMGLSDAELNRLADEMYHVYLGCWQKLDVGHPQTLAAAITRASLLQRIPGRAGEAAAVVGDTQRRYRTALGDSHPYTSACGALLAGIRLRLGGARESVWQPEPGTDFTPLPL